MDPRRVLPVLAAATAVVVVATLVSLGWRTWSSGGGEEGSPAGSPVRAVSGVPRGGGPSAAAVLAAWDARRALAWARADAGALRRLYAPGSRAGKSDVALLRRYSRRGLRVTGLQTQVLDLEVVAARPGRLRLVVTDRLVGGEAVGDGRSVALPRDRPSTRRIVLVKEVGTWVVDHVQDVPGAGQPSAAASTSRTSRSSKS